MTKRYAPAGHGVVIDVTRPAEKIIAHRNPEIFVWTLARFMEEVGSDYAYVGKTGRSLRVHLNWPPESRAQEGPR